MFDITLRRVDNLSDYDEVLQWLQGVLVSKQPVSLDLETCSIEKMHTYGRGYSRLFQIGTADEAWAIDARDNHALCREILDRLLSAKNPIVYANMKFEAHVFLQETWPTMPWHRMHDVIAMHRLVRSEQKLHGLKPSCGEEFGPDATAGQDLLKQVFKNEDLDWDTVPTDREEYWGYGALDTSLTVRLYNALLPEVPAFYEVEQEYQRITHGWEVKGIRVDQEAVHHAHNVWTQRIESISAPLADLGFTKPGSSNAVRDAFKAIGHEPTHFSDKTGDPKFDKMVLTLLQSYGGNIAAAAELLMQHRQATTWRNNYGVKLLTFLDKDDRIHPSILTSQARTGRSSIVNPPLQTIPKEEITRNMFLPSVGMRLWAVDYSSQEIRIMAAMSNDPALIAFFEGEESDYHQYVADLTNIPRGTAKTISYARPYGAGTATMARTAGCTEPEMLGYLAKLDAKFPGVAGWLANNTAQAELLSATHGFPYVTLPYGRTSALEAGREHTQASNTLIQGHGADVLKLAACRLAAAGYEDYMILAVHDELLYDVPADDEPFALLLMQQAAEIMEDNKLQVPLTCDITGPLSRWGEAYKKVAA